METENDSLIIDYINTIKSRFISNLSRIKNILSSYKLEEIFDLMEYLNQKPKSIQDEYNGLGLSFLQCSLFPIYLITMDNL